MVVSLKFQTDLVVKDPQVAVSTAHDRLRDNPLRLLRDKSDMGFFASIINEAIEAKAVVEMAEQDDLVLKPKIGSPSAATATPVKTASAAVKASPKAASAAVEAAVTARPKAAMAAIAQAAPSWRVRRPYCRSVEKVAPQVSPLVSLRVLDG